MGRAKEEMMKWEELGCRPVGDKHICPDCVGDHALKAFIAAHALHEDCDYCGKTFLEPACAEADTLMEHIAESIGYEYEDPAQSVSYCSAEGGYLLATMHSGDLISHFDLGEFAEDAETSLDGLWVEIDPYGDRPWEHMLSSWGAFAHHVKHRQRFFFPRAPAPDRSEDIPDSSILAQVAEVATDAGMVKTIPAGTVVFRARQHAAGAAPGTAAGLGTPPADAAVVSNRMSPAGIPLFYGARDAATARAETETNDPTKPEITVGTFVLPRDLTILDLANVPEVPSLFDAAKRHLRVGLRFIHGFANDLALPITRDGREAPLLNRAELIVAHMAPLAAGLEVEKFWVLCLNRKNRLLKRIELTTGTATAALAHPREIFRAAVRESATAIVCVHNHPSGDPAPSAPDLQVGLPRRRVAAAPDRPSAPTLPACWRPPWARPPARAFRGGLPIPGLPRPAREVAPRAGRRSAWR